MHEMPDQFHLECDRAVIISCSACKDMVPLSLQILGEDGALLACLFSAASAALVDAGVPLKTCFGMLPAQRMSGGHSDPML